VRLTLILASRSPRRYQILRLLHLPFLVIPPEVTEESSTHRSPLEEARYLAQCKAVSLTGRFRDAVVIGSDTLINLRGDKIGKPVDKNEAAEILRRLRGREHEVVTAVTVACLERRLEHVEITRILMRNYSDAEIEAYLATGEGLDKAGAYSLQGQGRRLLVNLKGDYLAAVGLPLKAVAAALMQMGLPSEVDVEEIYRQRDFLNWKTFA
jgi:septum formation protein